MDSTLRTTINRMDRDHTALVNATRYEDRTPEQQEEIRRSAERIQRMCDALALTATEDEEVAAANRWVDAEVRRRSRGGRDMRRATEWMQYVVSGVCRYAVAYAVTTSQVGLDVLVSTNGLDPDHQTRISDAVIDRCRQILAGMVEG